MQKLYSLLKILIFFFPGTAVVSKCFAFCLVTTVSSFEVGKKSQNFFCSEKEEAREAQS